jgi:hypothetical protein
MRAIAHPDLQLSGTTLVDTTLGTHYSLTPDAAWLFAQLQQEPHIEYLVPLVAHKQSLSHADARRAVYTLLGLLDTFGGLRVAWQGALGRFVRYGVHRSWHRRYPGTLRGFMGSMSHAYGLMLLAGTLICVGCVCLASTVFAGWWAAVPGLLLSSCVLHEGGHGLAAWLAGVRVVYLARPASAAIMYRRPAKGRARLIAASGPLAATLSCAFVACMVSQPLLRGLLVATGFVHLCSLLPFLADGKTLWRNI